MSPRKTRKQSAPPPNLLGILACCFLSGAAGLIYQVTWVKALGLIFGHTVYAVATVLAVFMAGLAAGSAYLGSFGKHQDGPIILYVWVECLVAATGALSLAGLAGVRWLYVAAFPATANSTPLLLALRFFGATPVLFVPAFLMGGTLPILVGVVVRNPAELGVRVSHMYWINTLGAVAGTIISGFVLLPTWGMRGTIAFAVVLNVLSGLTALWIAKYASSPKSARSSPSQVASHGLGSQAATSRFLLLVFAIVGFTAFAYEIAWTRLLAITIGSSTYAFTLVLATFLLGTVIGSAIFHRFFPRSEQISIATFSRTQLGIGVATLSSLVLFQWIPAVIPPLLRTTHQTFGGLVLAQFVTSALTLLPMATIFGFNFPMVVVLLDHETGSQTDKSVMVGRAYAANTIGAVVGSVVTGFWLIPWLGSFRVIAVAAAINLLLALSIDVHSLQRRILSPAIALLCVLFAVFVGTSSFFYNPSLLSLSAVLYGNSHSHLTLREIAATYDLVFTEDGVNDSIAVARTDDTVALRVNGKVDASTGDAPTQLLLGELGAALHPAPRRVLIIGFGSGMTVAAVASYPDVEQIDCVEIEPAVIRAAPYLESLNRNVLRDPRVRIIFDDARNFLLTSREKYDLIISEPSNPWIAGIATLFTEEYYVAARQRLAPGGMFVQWLQAYLLEPADLRMVMATFAPQFKEVTLWRGEGPDLLLLGRTETAPFQFDRLRALWQGQALHKDFESINVHQPEGLVAYYLLGDTEVRKLAEGGKLNTDDRTLLEYDAPRTLLKDTLADANQALITQFRAGPLPMNLAPSEFRPALRAGLVTALDLNDAPTAKGFLKALESQPESASTHIARGRLALMQGAIPDAESSFDLALKVDPDSAEAMHWLAMAEHRGGDDTSARSHVNEILERHRGYLPALKDQMQFALERKDFPIALLAQLTRMALIPDLPAYEYCRLGGIWLKIPNFVEAETALLKGIQKDPYSYSCHLELGELYRKTNRFAQALQNFEWVVRFFPDVDASIFSNLAGVYVVLGDTKAAGSSLRKGHRLFPDDAELQKDQALLKD